MTKCLDSAKLATAIEEAVNGSVCQDSSDELLLEIDKLLEVLWFLKTENGLWFTRKTESRPGHPLPLPGAHSLPMEPCAGPYFKAGDAVRIRDGTFEAFER